MKDYEPCPVFRLVGASRRRQARPRQVGLPGRHLRPRRRRHQGGQGPRLPLQHQLHAVQQRRSGADGELLRQRHGDGRRRHHRVAGLCLRARARPAALPQPRARPSSCSATSSSAATAARNGRSASPACSSTSSPATRLPLHAVGQPDPHGVRLAEALLPARRRLRQDLQGADGKHRLGRLRRRQLREVRRLHGPFAASRPPPSRTPSSIRSRRWAPACAASRPRARWRRKFRSIGQRPAQYVFSRHVDQKLTEIQENKARSKQATAA